MSFAGLTNGAIVKNNNGTPADAVAGVDYSTISFGALANGSIIKNNAGAAAAAVAGTDYGYGRAAAPITPLAAAADRLEFTGLAGNTDRYYRARFRIRNATGGLRNYALIINNATTGITFFRLYGDASAAFSDNNGVNIKNLQDLAQMEITLNMEAAVQANFLRMGTVTVIGNAGSGTTPNLILMGGFVWNNAATEITRLGILGDNATACGIGSEAALERTV